MSYALRYREELPPAVIRELDDLVAYYNSFLKEAHNADGTLKLSTISGAGQNDDTIMDQIETAEGHWWKKGPWIFDRIGENTALIRTPTIPSGSSLNDWAPQGIDTAVGVLINIGGSITITGMKAPLGGHRRALIFQNQSATSTDIITLKHESASSAPLNRFSLPGAVDLEVGPRQTVWLLYDSDNGVWEAFITANTSGGLFGSGGAGGGEFSHATVTLSAAQCRALNGTPVTLVAGVAGKIIIPFAFAKRVTTSSAFSAVLNASTRYIGTAQSVGNISLFANGTARYDGITHTTAGFSNIATDLRGLGVEIYNAGADPTGGAFSVGLNLTTFYDTVDWAA